MNSTYKRSALTFLTTLLICQCSCSSESRVTASERKSTPVIFIHGIKGGSLIDSKDHTQWLTGAQALSLSTPDLRLPLEWKGDQQGVDALKSSGPLRSVKIIPGILQQDVYGSWLKAAENSDHPFYSFSYDWRRDNLETLEKFKKFVEKVRDENGGQKVQVVAHSMGGLITFALLNEHPDYFKNAVFAGVPFAGGVGFLIDLHAGDSVGTNSRILAPQILFTFPSVYTLFPLSGAGLEKNDGSPIAMDFYSELHWKAKRLGVFSNSLRMKSVGSADQVEKFLKTALSHAKRFRLLLTPQTQSYPPILVVSSLERPTLVTAIQGGDKSVDGWDLKSAPQAPGDGRVAERDALPPLGIPYVLYLSKAEHTQLLNDPKVIHEIDHFFR